MNIKLNARLSAYSKVDSIEHDCDIDSVTKSEIDELFKEEDKPISVTKSEIDELFKEDEDNPSSVTKSEIDELFNKNFETKAVTKASSNENDIIETVAFSEIDSLFK